MFSTSLCFDMGVPKSWSKKRNVPNKCKLAIFLSLIILRGPILVGFERKLRSFKKHFYINFSEVYCNGSLLHNVQMLKVYNDSKTFVDLKLKMLPNETMTIFWKEMENWEYNVTKDRLKDFISKNFDIQHNEFETWVPSDWIKNPKFLNSIKDEKLKDFACKINRIWKDLGRKIKDDVRLKPELYSLIYLPHPVIIPGGRFRELYYWDSYWIIRGLLLCEMNVTAKGMIKNYISMIKTFGHVPNGGRIYYSKRSQPPMLIPMMKSYFEVTNDIYFVIENIDMLEVEFQHWINNHNVTIYKNGKNYTLAVYKDSSTGPRPESYREDIEKAEHFKTKSEKENFYSELKAAAESGWDFSSRWFVLNGTNKGSILNTKTRSIVPVDLNSLVYWNAKILSDFYRDINFTIKAEEYENISLQWRDAVTAVLWDEEVGSWLDFDMINNIKRNYFYPTNISPLWTGCYEKNKTDYFVSHVLNYLQKENILKTNGSIPTTMRVSKEQWDYPNAWPPLQYIIIKALENTGYEEAKRLASEIAYKWICTNYVAYKNYSVMYEKYRVDANGEPGLSTGEYPIQTGFGWSNGIILELLQTYNSTASIENFKITARNCYDVLINVTMSKNNTSESCFDL
ncbi:hypothetical protein QTP88_018944 [Uroleucon formosanum]